MYTHTEIPSADSDRHRHGFPVVGQVLTVTVTLSPPVLGLILNDHPVNGSLVDAVFSFPTSIYFAFLVFGISIGLGTGFAVSTARTSTRLRTIAATVLTAIAVSLTTNGTLGIGSDMGGICVGCPVHVQPYPTAH